MALQDIESTTAIAPGDLDGAAEFAAGLVKLMPFLRAFAQKLSRKRELAEDLAQEALAKAWRSRGSFNPGTNLKAWLFTIVRNEFFSHQRRAWRQVALEDHPVLGVVLFVIGIVLIGAAYYHSDTALPQLAPGVIGHLLTFNGVLLVALGCRKVVRARQRNSVREV